MTTVPEWVVPVNPAVAVAVAVAVPVALPLLPLRKLRIAELEPVLLFISMLVVEDAVIVQSAYRLKQEYLMTTVV